MRNESVYANTQKKFFEALWKLYKEMDIANITISDVVTVAGYNRTTFYKYFDN